MAVCKACTVLPEPLPREGILATAVQPREKERFEACMTRARVPFRFHASGFHLFDLVTSRLDDVVRPLLEVRGEQFVMSARASLVTSPQDLQPMSVLGMDPLTELLQRFETEWLVEMIREKSLTTVYQPIADLRRGDSVFGYECLMRGTTSDRSRNSPGAILSAARKANLLFQLDQLARTSAIRNAAGQGIRERVFINFLPTTVYWPHASLKSTLKAVQECGLKPEQIVFEVVESEEIEDTAHLLRILDVYREEGFGVALDDIGSGYNGLNLLTELQPNYVKLDAQLIRNVHRSEIKQHVASQLIELTKKIGCMAIVEGVETEDEWEWARRAGADLAQGYFYARPAAEPFRAKIAA
jgi:EAL domain-containing protein (putative c-di-GMP-specific phosphodiesterase class I)